MNHVEFLNKQQEIFSERFGSILEKIEDPNLALEEFQKEFRHAGQMLVDAIMLTTNERLRTVAERLGDEKANVR